MNFFGSGFLCDINIALFLLQSVFIFQIKRELYLSFCIIFSDITGTHFFNLLNFTAGCWKGFRGLLNYWYYCIPLLLVSCGFLKTCSLNYRFINVPNFIDVFLKNGHRSVKRWDFWTMYITVFLYFIFLGFIDCGSQNLFQFWLLTSNFYSGWKIFRRALKDGTFELLVIQFLFAFRF